MLNFSKNYFSMRTKLWKHFVKCFDDELVCSSAMRNDGLLCQTAKMCPDSDLQRKTLDLSGTFDHHIRQVFIAIFIILDVKFLFNKKFENVQQC